MPKKNSKGKKKGKGENANKTTTPAFLLPSTSTGTVAPTLDNELTGLPETPGKETSEIEALQGQALDRPSTPIVVVRDPSSTTSSPPQDAAAVLAALAARSPWPISPRPAPLSHPTAPDVFSQTIASPTRAIDSKLDTDGASSIHSNTAPSVIKGSYGKGVSFIPSSQLVTAPEYNADQSNAIAQAERPSWGRSASGAAREIVKSEAKKGKNALKKKHAHPDSGRGADEIEQVYNAQVGEDPVVEKEVDEMVKKGKIKVGVEPRLPDNVPPVKNRGQRHGDEEEKDTNEKKEKKQERNEHAKSGENVHKQEKDQQKEDEAVEVGQTSGRGEPHQAEHQARWQSVEYDKEPSPQEPIQPSSGARTGDSRSYTMIPPKEAHDEMTNESEKPIDADTPLRQRRRGLLGAPLDNPRISNPVPDSDEDRVLNEVKEKSREASTERSRFARSSSGQVYIPPYKTRKPYDPCPLAASEDKSNLALALSTTITRHSLLPFTSTRRVEIRLAWKEPTSWKWIPMRRYIPDWTVEYVGKRSDDQPGMIRKVVRGVVSFIPVVGRFADWI